MNVAVSKHRCQPEFQETDLWRQSQPDSEWEPVDECNSDVSLAEVISSIKSVVENALSTVNMVTRMESLASRVADLETRQPEHEYLNTLSSDVLCLTQQIPISVLFNGDDFVARFGDAGISATGETRTEAVWNLGDMIVLKFMRLCEIASQQLGPVPRRQLSVLRSFIKKV